MGPRLKIEPGAREGALVPLLLRPRDVAALLAVSERTVWMLLRGGALTAIRPPGMRAVRIARNDLDALVARWQAGASPAIRPDKSLLRGPEGSR